MNAITLSRVYDRERRLGRAFLVERLWPRGVRREELQSVTWLREVAPSTELRRWFAHAPQRWGEFRRRYAAELDVRSESWQPIVDALTAGDVTLVYSARDRDHNNAVALRDYLRQRVTGATEGRKAAGPHSSGGHR